MNKIFILFIILSNVTYSQSIEKYLSAPFPSHLEASDDDKAIAWVFNDKGSEMFTLASVPALMALILRRNT